MLIDDTASSCLSLLYDQITDRVFQPVIRYKVVQLAGKSSTKNPQQLWGISEEKKEAVRREESRKNEKEMQLSNFSRQNFFKKTK